MKHDPEKAYYGSPIGLMEICADPSGITSITFIDDIFSPSAPSNKFLIEAIRQLDEYFNRSRKAFNISLSIKGTPFQQSVWNVLKTIPFGSIETYRSVAERIGKSNAVRAVGNANSRNKFAIVIPCHRVMGSNKSLTGYARGLSRKEWLLKHEQITDQHL